MSIKDPTPEDVLDFWFNEAGPSRWYTVSTAFDAVIRRRFAKAVEGQAQTLSQTGEHAWMEAPESALALVLMFDQFPRNIWRGSGRAFAYDPLARQISLDMIDRGFDWAIPAERRDFVYMPFMHAEDMAFQDLCVEMATTRLEQDSTAHHARQHREIFRQFGRFPYRNEALGRESTPEEITFLETARYIPGRKDSAKTA